MFLFFCSEVITAAHFIQRVFFKYFPVHKTKKQTKNKPHTPQQQSPSEHVSWKRRSLDGVGHGTETLVVMSWEGPQPTTAKWGLHS
ncbi:UNVERIFIED_CONTAM: hypothetical protein FKN15_058055 [Acipenser sinensis]